MARLIDADNIISVCEILSEKGNNPHYWGQLISIIKDMPTIDAIPVEWIRNIKENLPESIEKMGLDAVLILWAQEQEAR